MDRPAPIRPSQGQALIVGDRDERGVGKLTDHLRQPRQIEPSVHRREEGHAGAAEQWQMQPVDVRVHDVEICDPLRERLEQSGAGGRGIGGGPAEAERAGPDRMQIPTRAGISAGEQRHLVAQADELVDQPRDHPLCPAVKLGRNALGQGRDLGNPHDGWSGPLLVGTRSGP
jgi:hypothetical protein